MPERLAFRGAFKASAADGTDYLIDVFQVMHDRSQAEPVGLVLYRTTDGRSVKRIRRGVYEIEESRVSLRLIEPAQRDCDHHPQDQVAGSF
jgi:hypothetical protein